MSSEESRPGPEPEQTGPEPERNGQEPEQNGQEPEQTGPEPRQSGRAGEQAGTDGYGWVIVERSGGIGGMLMAWELDIDSSADREELGRQVAELPWTRTEEGADDSEAARTGGTEAAPTGGTESSSGGGDSSGGGADRFEYLIESRYGRVRFGEARMPQEWKRLVDDVRHSPEARRRRPGRD